MNNIEDIKNLEIKKENLWNKYRQEHKELEEYMDEYKEFLTYGLSEKRVCKYIKEKLTNLGYVDIKDKETLNMGDKIYFENREKNIFALKIGEDILNGLNIVGAHADSPRLDIKQIPFFEDKNLGLSKTVIYGGIKKHQWTTIPLILLGEIYKTNGEKIEVSIGEDKNDPVLTITELLPHLASRQMAKGAKEFIDAEQLNVLFGGIPLGKEQNGIKLGILNILNSKYKVSEIDLGSSELIIVPAFSARDVGLDRSFIGSYGQDDRSCVFASFKAFINSDENIKRTKMLLISDKEEIGSTGNTGMQSATIEYFLNLVLTKLNKNYPGALLKVFNDSKMLSADVTAAIDPIYIDVHETLNDPLVNGGVCIMKYTGGIGKTYASDANPKYVADIRRMFEEKNIKYQYAAMGKQGIGGGGTIAYILANKGVEVLDCGPAILSMHSPFEVASKADIYETYLAYKAFYADERN